MLDNHNNHNHKVNQLTQRVTTKSDVNWTSVKVLLQQQDLQLEITLLLNACE